MSDTFDLSMAITGDSSSAVAAAKETTVETLGLAAAQAKAVVAADQLSAAMERQAASAGKSSQEQAAAADNLARAQLNVAKSTLQVQKAQAAIAAGGAGHGFGTLGIAAQEAEHSVRAFVDSINAGQSPMRAFTLELPRLAQAVGFAGGSLGKVGEFLSGGWGIALTVGLSVLAPFAEKLLSADDTLGELAADLEAAAKSADAFGNAQKLVAGAIDLTTGALKTHNTTLLETIRLQAETMKLQGQQDEQAARKSIAGVGNLGVGGTVSAFFSRTSENPFTRVQRLSDADAPLRGLRDDILAGNVTDATEIRKRIDTMEQTGQLAGKTAEQIIELKKQLFSLPQALNTEKAGQEAIDALDGKGLGDLKEYERAKKQRTKKAPDTSGLVNSVTNDIASFNGEFSDAPTFIEKADAALRKLDQDSAALAKKKPFIDPKTYQSLLDGIASTKGVIEANLTKPFDDWVKEQEEALAVTKLQDAGFVDQAAALKEVQAQAKVLGAAITGQYDATKYTGDEYERLVALAAERRATILQIVQAQRAEADAVALVKERQQDLSAGLKAYREDIEGIFTGTDKLKDLPGRLVADFKSLSGKLIFDKLFGSAFQQLQNQIDGTDKVGTASDAFAKALDDTGTPIKDFGNALSGLTDKINGLSIGGGVDASKIATGITDSTGDFIGNPYTLPTATSTGGTTDPNEIVVNGRTGSSSKQLSAFGLTSSTFEHLARSLGIGASNKEVADALKKGIQIPDDAATKIGKFAGRGIEGAAQGALAESVFAPIAKGLGIKTSSTGASIGGALGGLTGIPGAGFIGGVLGSIVGGLFKKVKTGGATITDSTGDATLSGNSKSYEAAANSLAGSVQDGINQIAQQLGGTAGSFGGITIGQYKDKYRVNTISTKLGGSSSPVPGLTSYDTADDAVAAAIQDAVAKGAVSGLDAAVQKALSSSSDINKSLAEALQVQKVESLIGGIGYAFDQTFKSFDDTAKSNLAIAQKYGLDTVALEKQNAADRTKLISDTLQQQVGSLQDFINSTLYGDNADGSAVDKRNTLIAQIATTKTQADTGDTDAINQLADLYNQLLSTTRDAFGTAGGEYTSDKTLATTGAQQVIQQETDLINKAAGVSSSTTTAVQATTSAVNEGNDLLAINNSKMDDLIAAVKGISTGSTLSGGPALVRRSLL